MPGILLGSPFGTWELARSLEHEARHRSPCEGLGTLAGACRPDAMLGNRLALQLHSSRKNFKYKKENQAQNRGRTESLGRKSTVLRSAMPISLKRKSQLLGATNCNVQSRNMHSDHRSDRKDKSYPKKREKEHVGMKTFGIVLRSKMSQEISRG